MRVIIKPAGLICLVSAFGVLTAASVWRYQSWKAGQDDATALSAPPAAVAANAAAEDYAANPSADSVTAAPKTPAVKKPLPPGVLLMPDISSSNWKFLNTNGRSTSEFVAADVPGHPRARRIRIEDVRVNHWDVQMAHPLEVAFKKGQRVRLTYWARSKDSCPIAATVEQYLPPYSKIVYREESLTPEWRQYSEEWDQTEDKPADWAKIDFQIGYKKGEIEITGVIIRLAPKASAPKAPRARTPGKVR